MSYSFTREVPINESQYAEVRAALGTDTPKGLIAHLVVRHESGLRSIDVWDSEADWERFRDEHLNPAIAAVRTANDIAPSCPPPQQPIDVVDAWVGSTR